MSSVEKTFLPSIHNGPAVTGEGTLCGMNDAASEFVHLWLDALGPRAKLMRCDSRLVVAAQKHATWLASQPFEAIVGKRHIGQGGSLPNGRVRAEGYTLPSNWEDAANYVESCTPASAGAAAALEKFRLSPAHRVMVMGEDFWAASTVFGVGVAGREYVFVCAPPSEGN